VLNADKVQIAHKNIKTMPEGADGGSEKGRKFNLLLFTLAYIPPTQKHIQTHTRTHTLAGIQRTPSFRVASWKLEKPEASASHTHAYRIFPNPSSIILATLSSHWHSPKKNFAFCVKFFFLFWNFVR